MSRLAALVAVSLFLAGCRRIRLTRYIQLKPSRTRFTPSQAGVSIVSSVRHKGTEWIRV